MYNNDFHLNRNLQSRSLHFILGSKPSVLEARLLKKKIEMLNMRSGESSCR